ncbi:MAG: tetratricopeptide repeat protein [Phycisphaerales bacterium]
MQKPIRGAVVGFAAVVGIVTVCSVLLSSGGAGPDDILPALASAGQAGPLSIENPLNETLFPPEIPAPVFRWKDSDARSDLWLVTIEFPDGSKRVNALVREAQWRPRPSIWEEIKRRSLEKSAVVTVAGVSHGAPSQILSTGRITIMTSSDKVGAPLFYREVNLPFVDAVKDPSRIRWRFGSISSDAPPPVVLEKLPVCGNCHSFSADGSVLGMDIDYANDKGSYAIAKVGAQMVLDRDSIITWGDYKRTPGEVTYGLLSQVSPDGRYVVSTVKDESVFVPKPGMEFSQLFFPVKGILCVYDRQTGVFQSLPGADDPNLVQSNATWSPDGKYIVFASREAHKLQRTGGERKVLLSPEECREFLEEGRPFKFNLYKIPFNEGKGGKAEPLAGASFNGKSNFFPRFSPDGKWIVFCKAENYMLLQPDSELYIIPAGGGEARRLRANTRRMNSWHSFSPSGKWLVFSGKPDSAYTRLYLTHIDERGESTPAVVLDHLTSPDRAANIPEFVNADPDAIRRIRERFIDDVSYARAAWEFLKSNDYAGAERQARRALELNPRNADALHHLGLALFGLRQYDEAVQRLSEAVQIKPKEAEMHIQLGVVLLSAGKTAEAVNSLEKALQIAPDNGEAHFNLGVAMFRIGNRQEATKQWLEAVRLRPDDHEAHYNLAMMLEQEKKFDQAIEHYRLTVQAKPDHVLAQANLGLLLSTKGSLQEGLTHLAKAVELDPANTTIRFNLAITLGRLGRHDQAIAQWQYILQREVRNAEALEYLGIEYAQMGQFERALSTLDQALQAARSAGDEKLASQIAAQIQRLEQNRPAGASRGR